MAPKPEGKTASLCPVCTGTGGMVVRVQRQIHGQRRCANAWIACPVCHGTKEATHADLEAFLHSEGLAPEQRDHA